MKNFDKTFDMFWNAYPRKIGKRAAEAAFNRACKRGNVTAILNGALAYRDDPERKRKGTEFTAHPTTWLNQDRWLDEREGVSSVQVVDLTQRFEHEPEGITFAEWLEHHATPVEIEKARQFGVARLLEQA